MKTLFYLSLISLVAWAGCGKKEAPPAGTSTNKAAVFNNAISNNSSGNPLTAPVDYLGAVAKAQQSSLKSIDTAYINQAVQQFQAMEGRLPKDLQELVAEKYLVRLPQVPHGMKLEYEAATGKVKVVPGK